MAFRKERSTGSGELAIHSMDGRCYKTGGRLGKKLVIKAKLMEGSSVGEKKCRGGLLRTSKF